MLKKTPQGYLWLLLLLHASGVRMNSLLKISLQPIMRIHLDPRHYVLIAELPARPGLPNIVKSRKSGVF
jgi:hypothetical protein